VTAFWCTTIVALVFVHLLICTSFTSASHPARLGNSIFPAGRRRLQAAVLHMYAFCMRISRENARIACMFELYLEISVGELIMRRAV
jgi:hypothetical protein